jgi:hypothetical protein
MENENTILLLMELAACDMSWAKNILEIRGSINTLNHIRDFNAVIPGPVPPCYFHGSHGWHFFGGDVW